MKTNEIPEEIYRVREDIARECNYDVDVLFARMREEPPKPNPASNEETR